jgi:type VI secretion system protein ImpJ
MALQRPVRWSEGLLLRPHHLQQHQAYAEAREHALLAGLVPFGWGLVRLEIREDLLDNLTFAVHSVRAIFPDGTLVDVPGNASLPGRGFAQHMTDGRPLDVGLGIRNPDPRRSQTAPDDGAEPARFHPRTVELTNIETGEDARAVEVLDFSARVFFGSEPTDGYDVVPLCRLLPTGNRARPVAVDGRFAPPALSIGVAPGLLAAVQGVTERLSRVIPVLAETRGGQDPGPLLLFQVLGGALPVLRDLVQDGEAHPRAAYQALARLAGALLYRDDQGRLPDAIPSSAHRDPGPVFEKLRGMTHELSEPMFRRRFVRVPMDRTGDLFRAALPADARQPGVRLVLEVHALESAPRLRTLLMTAKISTAPRIETLARHALPGIPTEPLQGAPSELPPGQTASFFALRTDEGAEWTTHVLPSGEVAAFVLGAPADLKFDLLLLLPER